VPIIREFIAASMPQHVRVRLNWEPAWGVTVRFTVIGETNLRCRLGMETCILGYRLFD